MKSPFEELTYLVERYKHIVRSHLQSRCACGNCYHIDAAKADIAIFVLELYGAADYHEQEVLKHIKRSRT